MKVINHFGDEVLKVFGVRGAVTVNVEVLFDRPQKAIAGLIRAKLSQATSASIVTGFATPGGLAEILEPVRTRPHILKNFILGASTYPGYQALDDLLAVGVPRDRLAVHLGHTAHSGSRRHPYVRYRPMLHSKVYYFELPGSQASAFIGSHNVTSYALAGLNGEASVLLTGHVTAPQFDSVRRHLASARAQSVQYDAGMKAAYAWWYRQYIEGLEAEVQIPQDWQNVRTIIALLQDAGQSPTVGQTIYFELPAGIEHIESLRTELHLYLFSSLPAFADAALADVALAATRLRCQVTGVENRQGNQEIDVDWRIDERSNQIVQVPGGTLRPGTQPGKQQVRAIVTDTSLDPLEYAFERERKDWVPVLSDDDVVWASEEIVSSRARKEAGGDRGVQKWQLVTNLRAPDGTAWEEDQVALERASPRSGAFILVALRRRKLE